MSTIHFPIIPPVIAHRGACAYAPENTLASFSKAFDLGVKWVEFDVMLAACGEAVVIHDETLERTTNGKGNVIDYPYRYLKTLDAGSWFGPQFVGEKIPTLLEVIEFLRVNHMAANIEIKAQAGMEEATVIKTLELLKIHWKSDMPQPLLSSFSLPTLEYLRKQSSSSLLGFLMHEWQEDWEESCDRIQCVSVNTNHEILNQERINKIKSTQRWLLSYTVNDSGDAKKLFASGVDAVFSDCPDKILSNLF